MGHPAGTEDRAGEDDMSCTVGQHSLKVLLYPTPCTAPFGTCKLSLFWGGCRMTGLCWGNAAEKFRLKPTLTPSGFLGGGEKACKI